MLGLMEILNKYRHVLTKSGMTGGRARQALGITDHKRYRFSLSIIAPYNPVIAAALARSASTKNYLHTLVPVVKSRQGRYVGYDRNAGSKN